MDENFKCPTCGIVLEISKKKVMSLSELTSKKELLDRAFERIKAETSPSGSCSASYPKYALACTCCIVGDGTMSKSDSDEGNWDFPYHIDFCPKHR